MRREIAFLYDTGSCDYSIPLLSRLLQVPVSKVTCSDLQISFGL